MGVEKVVVQDGHVGEVSAGSSLAPSRGTPPSSVTLWVPTLLHRDVLQTSAARPHREGTGVRGRQRSGKLSTQTQTEWTAKLGSFI